jgi:hypothetical protein
MQKMTRRRLISGGILLAASIAAVWGIYKGIRIYRYAIDLKESAGALSAALDADLQSLNLAQLADTVHKSRGAAEGLQKEFRPLAPIFTGMRWIPSIGPTIAAASPAIDFAAGLSAGADELFLGLSPILEAGGEELGPEAGSSSERLFRLLVVAQPHLAAAEAHFEQALKARASFDPDIFPEPFRSQFAKIDKALEIAGPGISLLRSAPGLLGQEGKNSYLLLAQNRDELRATGGFITGVGLLVIEQGKILEFTIGDSYTIDDPTLPYPPPPEPLQRYMLAGYWVLRDANWSPDFPTAARKAQELYELSTGLSTDGVIAFDQTAIEMILAAVGPVQLAGVEEPVDTENVISYMHEAWAPEPGEARGRPSRKDFMAILGTAILERAQTSVDMDQLLAVSRAARTMLEEKHLLLYFSDPVLQSALEALDWDGAVDPGNADFLMLIDSNVGFNKVDPNIERSIKYQVDLSDPFAPDAILTIRYAHQLQIAMNCIQQTGKYMQNPEYEGSYELSQRDCYWSYFRLYAPDGAEALSGTVPAIPSDWLMNGKEESGQLIQVDGEAGTTIFQGILVVPTGEAREVYVHYSLPDTLLQATPIGGWLYSLRLQKQPGTNAIPVEVIIHLPEGHQIGSDSTWQITEPGIARWSGRLWTDIDLELQIEPSEGG